MGSGRSTISFRNSYGKKLWVAYMRLDWDCGADCGEPWEARGWVALDPGETEYRSNPTSNRWFYYYAEAEDGAFWAGPYVAGVSNSVFAKCTCIGVIRSDGTSPYYDVGFRELDSKTYSGVNFVS
jgi:hypothetical protein